MEPHSDNLERYAKERALVKRIQNAENNPCLGIDIESQIGTGFQIAEDYRRQAEQIASWLLRDYPAIDPNDVVQEALIFVSQEIYKYDELRGTEVGTYVNLLIKKSILDQRRKYLIRNKRIKTVSLSNVGINDSSLVDRLESDDECPSQDSSNNEFNRNVRAYVQRHISYLNEKEREMIEYWLDGRDPEEISHRLGITNEQARQKYTTIFRRLRARMNTEKDKLGLLQE